jgi:hypothetical protein
LPVVQLDGKNDIKGTIKIPLGQKDKKIDIKVKVDTKKTNIKIQNKLLYFDKLNIALYNNIVNIQGILDDTNDHIKARFKSKIDLDNLKSNGIVALEYKKDNISFYSNSIKYNVDFKDINNIKFVSNTKQAKLIYQDKAILLKDIFITKYKDSYISHFDLANKEYGLKTYLNCVYNTNVNIIQGTSYIKQLNYDDTVVVNNEEFYFNGNLNSDYNLKIPKFGFNFIQNNSKLHQGYKINIAKPEILSKYIKNISFTKNKEQPSVLIIGSKNTDKIRIVLNNLNIFIKKQNKPNGKDDDTEKFKLPDFPNLNIMYKNGILKYDKFFFSIDRSSFDMNHNALKGKITSKKGKIDIDINNNYIAINSKNLKDEVLNNIFNKKVFKGGFANINIYGQDIYNLSGDIHLENTTVVNVPVVNNLITFINTTPALINPLLALPTLFRMAENGFDTNGYHIKKADGKFRYNTVTTQLNVYDFFTEGQMANFRVNATMNIEKDKLKSVVDIEFLKDYASVINKIPLIGYILIGDDGAITTTVNIDGTFKKQNITTNTIEDTATGIFGVFGRIITLPFQPFIQNDKDVKIKKYEKSNIITQ